jgi:hypothetical protein
MAPDKALAKLLFDFDFIGRALPLTEKAWSIPAAWV